uniref:Putative extracellular protein CSOL_101 n=1 Tax=Pseudococcomyxa simplex TaxID=464287 RepID=A0A7L9QEA6_9CHLO|nr:putative extracellular protein CSOL_101 [Pseudococcomyxa simplex]
MFSSRRAFVCLFLVLQICSLQASSSLSSGKKVSGSDGVSKVHLILPHKANATATVPVNFTLTYPADPQITLAHPKPLVLLLNGASVESFWYSRVIERLAKQRFVVASSDYYRAFPYKTRVLPRPGCRQDAIVDVSARLINTLYDFIENVTNGDLGANREFDFLRRANLGQLLLLSHSLGAFVACDVLTGGCEADASGNGSCEGYTPVLNKDGRDVVIGVVAFEGYITDTKGKPKEIALPDGTFVLYLAGQYNKRARDAYRRTHKSDSCASYVSFHNMTHYGMNDFVSPPESHQVTPCAAPIPTDDPKFTTDAATQNAGVDLIADIINAAVSVREQGIKRAVDFLDSLADQPRVLEAIINTDCLRDHAHSTATSEEIDQE